MVCASPTAGEHDVAVLGRRGFARTGKVVMLDWLALVVLWLDVDEMILVAAAVEGRRRDGK